MMPSLGKRAPFLYCALLLLVAGCIEEKRQPTLYIVFVDMTRSMNQNQSAEIRSTLEKLLDVAPPHSQFEIWPLAADAAHAGVLARGKLPDVRVNLDKGKIIAARAGILRTYSKASEQFLANKKSPQLQRTCVSGALRQAAGLRRQYEDVADVELVFISDMLEDCDRSLIGGRVDLQKNDITKEIERAEAVAAGTKLLDLNGANVTMIIPPEGPRSSNVVRPPLPDVERFWSAILTNSGHNRETFSCNTFIPPRLLGSARH